MTNVNLKLLSLFFLSILAVSFVIASVGDESYFDLSAVSYEAGEQLRGFVNLSLSAESTESDVIATVSGEQQITSLLEFLKGADADYTCQPANCSSNYEIADETGNLVLELQPVSNLVGFKIKEEGTTNVRTPGLSFDVTAVGAFSATCGEIPLKIDLLDDGSIDWQYLESLEEVEYCDSLEASKSRCYLGGNTDLDVGTISYCQIKYLEPTTKIKLGANLKKKTAGVSGTLTMSIHNPDTLESTSCILSDPSELYELQECTIDFAVKEAKDYHICIVADSEGYSIRAEQQPALKPMCGYVGEPPFGQEANADFALYAQIAKIKSFASATFDETTFYSETVDLTTYLNEYISGRYNNNCAAGCVVPMTIESNEEIEISNVDIPISYGVGLFKTLHQVYPPEKVEKSPALIDIPQAKLSLDALAVEAPIAYGNYTLLLNIGSKAISPTAGVEFSVVGMPQILSISPLIAFAVVETIFTVNASSPIGNKIVSYDWDFGDNSDIKTTTNGTASHTYQELGSYNLTVEAKDEQGLAGSATFLIEVGAPKEITNITLNNKKAALADFSIYLNTLPSWQQQIVRKYFNIEELSADLDHFTQNFEEAVNDEDYLDVKRGLDSLPVPSSIEDSVTLSQTTATSDADKIKPSYIKELGGGSYDTSMLEETKNAIATWQSENLDVKVSGSVKTVVKDDSSTQDIFTLLNIELDPKETLNDVYFVILLPSGVSYEDVHFAEEYKKYGKKKA